LAVIYYFTLKKQALVVKILHLQSHMKKI